VHLALPVRCSLVSQEGRGSAEQGARLVGSRDVTIGDLVMVERGRSKAICQVDSTADPTSALRGQFTV
jgi:hypothetical protein